MNTTHSDTCPDCYGEGERHVYDGDREISEGRCSTCEGTGEVCDRFDLSDEALS